MVGPKQSREKDSILKMLRGEFLPNKTVGYIPPDAESSFPIFANKTTHQIRLKVAGTELSISSEDLDFSNEANERLSCQYQGEDLEIGFNSKFLMEMLNNLSSEQINLEMSAPNRAGILIPQDEQEEGEQTLMLVMPVMLNN